MRAVCLVVLDVVAISLSAYAAGAGYTFLIPSFSEGFSEIFSLNSQCIHGFGAYLPPGIFKGTYDFDAALKENGAKFRGRMSLTWLELKAQYELPVGTISPFVSFGSLDMEMSHLGVGRLDKDFIGNPSGYAYLKAGSFLLGCGLSVVLPVSFTLANLPVWETSGGKVRFKVGSAGAELGAFGFLTPPMRFELPDGSTLRGADEFVAYGAGLRAGLLFTISVGIPVPKTKKGGVNRDEG